MSLPTHTPEYYAARKPFLDRLKAQLEPHWQRFLKGEVTHAEYCELVAPSLKAYSKDPKFEAVWVAHGGAKQQ